MKAITLFEVKSMEFDSEKAPKNIFADRPSIVDELWFVAAVESVGAPTRMGFNVFAFNHTERSLYERESYRFTQSAFHVDDTCSANGAIFRGQLKVPLTETDDTLCLVLGAYGTDKDNRFWQLSLDIK